jgi:hypothetical protein
MMRRDTGTFLFLALAGALFWVAAVLLPRQPAAMPLGTADLDGYVEQDEEVLVIPAEVPVLMQERLRYADADLRREHRCLALNVYFESKGEPIVGQMAVAAVTLNRLDHPRYPKTICDVVWQGIGYGRSCQFSWACDRRRDVPVEDKAWQRAQQIAYRAMFVDPGDPTDGAIYFHANYVRPSWSYEKQRIVRIGRHIFYADQPRWSAENISRSGRS